MPGLPSLTMNNLSAADSSVIAGAAASRPFILIQSIQSIHY
jgi:hypothetical protein